MLDKWMVVDLTLTLSEAHSSTWPGDVRFQTNIVSWFEDREALGLPVPSFGPYQTHAIHMSDHTGTHCDAPSHFIPPPDSGLPHAGEAGRLSVDKLAVDQYMGPAAVIDTRAVLGRNPDEGSITPEVVLDFEQQYGRLNRGDIVLFYSGWSRRYVSRNGYYGPLDNPVVEDTWNAPTVETIELLLDRGAKAVGTDGPSMGTARAPQSVHVAALGRGLGVVEGLFNLDQIPARGSYFLFLPLKLAGGTGGPGRAIAFVPKR